MIDLRTIKELEKTMEQVVKSVRKLYRLHKEQLQKGNVCAETRECEQFLEDCADVVKVIEKLQKRTCQ